MVKINIINHHSHHQNDTTITKTTLKSLTLTDDLGVASGGTGASSFTAGAILIGDGTNFNPVAISGDISIAANGTAAIGSGVIVNADVNASAAIAMSKTAFSAGTGVSLSTNTLNVDAAQTGITSILATDVKIGEDDETKIDFETANTINFYAGNEKQLILTDGALTPGANNILDLGSSGVEFKDGFFDGTVTADAFAGPLTGDVTGNISGTAATVTGAAQSNITSLGTLTTLTVDNVIINGSTIGHTGDTDLITVASGIATVAGEVSMTTLDIGGTNVTSTAAELNLLDGDTSVGGSITLADADGVVTNDGGTMKTIPASDIKTYVGAATGAFSIANLDIDGGTDIGEAIVDADLFIVDNGAGGTNRKVAASRLVTYVDANSSAASVGKAIAMAIVFG